MNARSIKVKSRARLGAVDLRAIFAWIDNISIHHFGKTSVYLEEMIEGNLELPRRLAG